MGTLSAQNYAFNFVSGTLTVTPAAPLVTVSCPHFQFNHHPHGCTATSTGIGGASVGGTFTITYNGSTTPPFAAGTYAITASFLSSDANYTNATGTGILVISKGHRGEDDDNEGDDD